MAIPHLSQVSISTPAGTPPLVVTSSDLVSNLNAQYLNGQLGGYYAAASSLASYLPLAGGTMTGELVIATGASSGVRVNSPSGTQGFWLRVGYDTDGTATPVVSLLNTTFQSSGSSSGTFSFVCGNAKALSISTSALNSLVALQQGGNQVLHSANVATYALPIGGGTLTGNVTAPRFISNQATGTAPFGVTSTTAVTNLNADLLDGQEGSYYQNAGNLNAGTLLAARLPAFTGDVSSTVGTVGLTLASVGTAGTYTKVTVNAKGLVTAGAALASADLPTYTGTITSGQVTTGLGFTPYNASNPSNYITASASITGNAATATTSNSIAYPFQNPGLNLNTTGGANGFTTFNSYYPSGGAYNQPLAGVQHFKILQFGRYDSVDANFWRGQMAMSFYEDRMWFRKEYAQTWGSWMELVHSGNYNSYSPTLGGTGATGNWAINITGSATQFGGYTQDLQTVVGTGDYLLIRNQAASKISLASAASVAAIVQGAASGSWGINAATATNGFNYKPGWAANQNLIGATGNLNSSLPSGFYEAYNATNSPTPTTWYNLINVRHSNPGNDHGFQLAMRYYDEVLWSRSYQGGTGANDGTFTTWRAHLHSGNFNSYALPLAGGTLTGRLTASYTDGTSGWNSIQIDAAPTSGAAYIRANRATAGTGEVGYAWATGGVNKWINYLNANSDTLGWYQGSASVMTLTTGGALTAASFSGLGTGLTGTAAGLSIGGNAATVGNVSKVQLFNNTGLTHGAYTTFAALPVFGFYFMQGKNVADAPPAQAANQYYVVSMGLGDNYSYSQYAKQIALPRIAIGGGNNYLWIRERENTAWGSWGKVYAGYADSAGTATDATKLPLAGGTMTGNLALNTGVIFNRGSAPSITNIQCSIFNELNGISNAESLNSRAYGGFKWQYWDGSVTWMQLTSAGLSIIGTLNATGTVTASGIMYANGGLLGTAGTFSGPLIVNNDNGVRASYDNGGSYAWLYGYGIEFGRATSYIRPNTNRVANLWVGNASINSQDWANIDFYSSGRFNVNNNAILHAANYNSYALPLTGGAITGAVSIIGQTVNGQSHYQWDGATYRNPGDWTATLIARRDNSTVGINNSIPALVLYNNNGGDQTTVGLSFASAEGATGQGNAVALAGIVARKEGAGNVGGWSSGSLNFYVKNVGARVDALNISSTGTANFPVGLQQGGNQVLHAGNVATYALPIYGLPSGSDQYVNFRVIRNTNAAGPDGMFIGYGNANSGRTRIYGDGSTSGYFYPDAYGNILRSDGAIYLHSSNYTSYPDATKLPLAGGTMTGILNIQSSYDNQLLLQGTDTWAGIGFRDSANVTDYMWWWGATQTFSIGGGGSTGVSGKKLHIHGGVTIGSSYNAVSMPTNGLNVEGAIQQGGNQVLHAGNYISSYIAKETSYTTPINASGYSWVRIPYAVGYSFNDGQSPIEFYVTRSIFANGSTPYGGCTAKFVIQSMEWHNGQQMATVQYGERGDSASLGAANWITHAKVTNLAGGGYWVYLRLRTGTAAGITYYIRRAAVGGQGLDPAQFENTTDPGGAAALYYGFNLISAGTEARFYRDGNQVLDAGNYTSYPDATKLPLAGGTLTGALNGTTGSFSGNLKGGRVTLRDDCLEQHVDDSDGVGIFVNYFGYNSGTTRFRNFGVFNGKNQQLLYITGSTGATAITGTLAVSSAITQGGNQVLHAGNVATYALPIGGGTLTGNRPLTIDSGGGGIYIKGDTGGWAMGYYFNGSSGTYKGGFGALGGGDALTNFWVGPAYNNTLMTFSSSANNSQVALQQGGNQVLHAGNFSSYALPYSGGTLTGGLTVTNLFGNANSASLYANNSSNGFGSWKVGGTRNSWYGIEFESGSNLMMNSNQVGFHRNGYGWQLWWSQGTAYCHKGDPGGGTQATILDSSNASYAWAMNQNVGTGNSPSFTGLSVINTITGSVSGSAGSVAWANVSGKPTAVSSFSNDSGYITSGGSISGSSGSCSGNAASVTDGVYLSNNQSISGVKTFASAPVATNIAKAWVHYNKSTTTITASYNVSSVTSNGTGVFTVNFTNAMVDANYVVTGTATYGYDDQDIYGMALIVPRRSTAQQAGSCRLATEFLHAAQVYDCVAVRAVFYR